ncbi:MAG: AmmeMemoRadiSam system radical SAM enzyme [Candidatus Omnitrophica bacterium]|nr:AmmeMemoRadiSam system radical SAM enzyme [Candidatus Omnitrophota bacterium]
MNISEKKISRREFLKKSAEIFIKLGVINSLLEFLLQKESFAQGISEFEAKYYQKISEDKVKCLLCPNNCILSNGETGFCRARRAYRGKLYSLVYGKLCALHVDPIEKKPLFHFLPGTTIFSIATAGCNFRCKFCQNWHISQVGPEEVYNYEVLPYWVIEETQKNNCPSIAFTYTEPSIFYEYMLDTAKLAKSRGIRTMYHSNGSLNPSAVNELSLYLDAANIDLKAFPPQFYREICSGYLETVLETLKILKKKGVWLEITNLVIPTLNDDLEKIKEMCNWIRDNLGEEVPLHFSRFHPQYKLTHLSSTPITTLEKAKKVAEEVGLRFVYIGNVPGHPGENTYCPKCKEILIKRRGFLVLENNLEPEGKCKFCGENIPGIWS